MSGSKAFVAAMKGQAPKYIALIAFTSPTGQQQTRSSFKTGVGANSHDYTLGLNTETAGKMPISQFIPKNGLTSYFPR